MIILISGNSCTGKTYMAQRLLEKYRIPYLSIDHLKMGLYRADRNCGFTPVDSTEDIGEKLWPILKGILMSNIENKQNLIIEGCYILPQYLENLESTYKEQVIAVFLGFSTSYIEHHFHSDIIYHRNVIETRMYPEESTPADVIREHEIFREKCLASGVAYFEIQNNYEDEILEVYNYIDREMKKIDRYSM